MFPQQYVIASGYKYKEINNCKYFYVLVWLLAESNQDRWLGLEDQLPCKSFPQMTIQISCFTNHENLP